MRKSVLLFATIVSVAIFSCSKETSLETGNPPTQPPGSGPGTGTACNNTVMKMTKLQALFDLNQYIRMSWTPTGNVDSIVMNLQLTEYLTAKYVYENNRIKSAALHDQTNGMAFLDSVIFRYNAAGKLDSMYRKQGGFGRSLKYDGTGKLVRLNMHESNGDILYYWMITTDAKGNITKAVEWYENGSGGYDKTATYLYSRDDKKSPFVNMAPYMLYLDDEYAIFRYWGPNNYIEQTYTDESMGFTLVTGEKNRYNSNCYPSKGQNTIMGAVLFPNDDDWEYFYQ